jgi:hypothetical protein
LFANERAFDLSYMLGLQPEVTNRYNILSESIYYQTYQALLETNPRQAFYQSYPFDVSPTTDDRPFFGHFFKWSQAGQVLSELGKTWQPFGGAGYFVIVALLILSICLAGMLILLPVVVTRLRIFYKKAGNAITPETLATYLLYFALIGAAYLFVEIPLIQKFILFLGNPAYSMTAVLFTLLLFSGMGSLQGKRISIQLDLVLLTLALIAIPALIPILFQLTLGLSFLLRLLLTVILLAPVGFLMGVPFPSGIRRLEIEGLSTYIPWAWAVNGSASVVSAVLAALIALSLGLTWVLRLGTLCYAGAWLAFKAAPTITASGRRWILRPLR